MAEKAIEIGVSVKDDILRGLLRPVRRARAGVLLVSSVPGNWHGPLDIYEELALYFQSAGITALQMAYRQPDSGISCIYDLLGGLEALRSWGMERAVLFNWSLTDSSGIVDGDNRPASSRRQMSTRRSTESGQMMPKIVKTIAGLAGVVVGVASITNQAPVPANTRRINRQGLRLLSSSSLLQADSSYHPALSMAINATTAGQMMIALGEQHELGGSSRALLLQQLYSWGRAVLLDGPAAAVQPPIQVPTMLHAPSAAEAPDTARQTPKISLLHAMQQWLDQQWQEVLASFDLRCPARSAEAHQVMRQFVASHDDTHAGYSLEQSGFVWPYLDAQARETWLDACSSMQQAVSEMANTFSSSGRRHSDHLAQRNA